MLEPCWLPVEACRVFPRRMKHFWRVQRRGVEYSGSTGLLTIHACQSVAVLHCWYVAAWLGRTELEPRECSSPPF